MNAHIGNLRQILSTNLPTHWGVFQTLGFERQIINGTRRTETALAIVLGDLTDGSPLVRIHSQCFTGEVLGSLRCDCNDQLELAMQAIADEGRGLVIYEHQEGRGVTTGISAHDRAETIRAAVDAGSRPEDFGRPGHIFPLRARPGGVLERRGQTEAAVDLAGLAGLFPAGVICEIVNDDGTMARVPDLIRFCQKHGLLMITVADLARHRLDADFENSLSVSSGLFSV